MLPREAFPNELQLSQPDNPEKTDHSCSSSLGSENNDIVCVVRADAVKSTENKNNKKSLPLIFWFANWQSYEEKLVN